MHAESCHDGCAACRRRAMMLPRSHTHPPVVDLDDDLDEPTPMSMPGAPFGLAAGPGTSHETRGGTWHTAGAHTAAHDRARVRL